MEEKDIYFKDIIPNAGIEIGNVIMVRDEKLLSQLQLDYNEYPQKESEIIKASDCLILLWIKYLPYPRTSDQWNLFERILSIAKDRRLINRFADLRSSSDKKYNGEERRINKPLRKL